MAFLLFDRIFGISIFHHVVCEGKDKMEVIEEFVSNVILVFYYRLTLSCSDFVKFHTR